MQESRTIVAAAAFCIALGTPLLCSAGGAWVSPVEGAAVTLAYGASYGATVHRGIDLAAAAGTPIAAPDGGQVVFAGRVPADGGGTCGAVTIELDGGLRLSLLPLSEVFVEQGDVITAGESVGAVASCGDDSSGAPHLHLGLRSGDSYLDPTGFLPATPTSETIDAPTTLPDAAGNAGRGSEVISRPAPVAGNAVTSAPSATGVPAALACAPVVGKAMTPAVTSPRVALRHSIPENSGIPVASQIADVRARGARTPVRMTLSAANTSSQAATAVTTASALLLLLAGVVGLTRQYAHSHSC